MLKLKKILITIGGILFIVFALRHLMYWKLLNWDTDLIYLTQANSNTMQILNIIICIFFISFAYLFLFLRNEMLNTKIGKSLSVISSIVFLARFIMEIAFPEGSIVLSIVLFVCIIIYFVPAIIK